MEVSIYNNMLKQKVELTKEQSVHIPRVGERITIFYKKPVKGFLNGFSMTSEVVAVGYDYVDNFILVVVE